MMNLRLKNFVYTSLTGGGLILIMLVILLLQGCMGQAVGGQQEKDAAVDPAIPVEASEVTTSDMAAIYSGTATLEADQQALVVSQTTGVVLEVLAEEGDFVESGQIVAKVETDRYRLAVEQANAGLKRLETDFNRKNELFRKKLVSAEDFERVSADYQAQKAAWEMAALELEYTNIRAPISGFVSERQVRPGNLVKLHDPVVRVTSYDPLLAVLHVPERELRVLRKGLDVSVALDAWPGELFAGDIIRISPVVDPATGTFRVTAQISDHDQMLKPGLFGRVEILYDIHQDVPVIPRSAVITEDQRSHVFVINETGSATRREVQLGYERAGMIEVRDGVVSGESVVTAGKGSLSDGSKVEVIDTGLNPGA
ncbi:MAG: efflux RND transporter periplasmic adaptor subunit [Xanthomonadales bacterium]|nr:efflux RND transporter periplasmic adaptor subunit [Gammaproteobacteria bacterium]MBT8054737.1 efflux RND transporter periplasmic adaptor subunit [Gammaproteobacteria bacterium]NND56279.1 efflux RND transporter periplasmic adaptor subunit [Xanthomonadales bacterium]NNK52915.1 efflux RND transporter periplasmic adaptor subunit [Xanthomonadales bacterium]